MIAAAQAEEEVANAPTPLEVEEVGNLMGPHGEAHQEQ